MKEKNVRKTEKEREKEGKMLSILKKDGEIYKKQTSTHFLFAALEYMKR